MQNNYNFSKNSLKMLKDVLNDLNNRGLSSYPKFDELSANNTLQNMIMTDSFRQTFHQEFRDYLMTLYSIYSTPFKYLHKVKLEDAFNRDCSFDLHFMEQYLLCLCCNNLSAYRNLPKLYVSLIHQFKIQEFQHFNEQNIQDLLNDNYRLKISPLLNYEGTECKIEHRLQYHEKEYKAHEASYRFAQPPYGSDLKWVWAEHRVWDEQKYWYPQEFFPFQPIWVARDIGDGFGFDILSYNYLTGKERLIEVKCVKDIVASLTENEAIVMTEANNLNAEYLVRHFIVNDDQASVSVIVYYYDPQNYCLRDENGNLYDLKYRLDDGKVKFDIVPYETGKILVKQSGGNR